MSIKKDKTIKLCIRGECKRISNIKKRQEQMRMEGIEYKRITKDAKQKRIIKLQWLKLKDNIFN